MNGKKFIVLFLVIVGVSGAALSIWIKQGYDSRPDVKVIDEKSSVEHAPADSK